MMITPDSTKTHASAHLWDTYVLARSRGASPSVKDLMGGLINSTSTVLFITGCGFDPRNVDGLAEYASVGDACLPTPPNTDLMIVTCEGYGLTGELRERTHRNKEVLRKTAPWAHIEERTVRSLDEEGKLRTSQNTWLLLNELPKPIASYSDIIVDVSSMPRVVYLTLVLHLLGTVVTDKSSREALAAAPNFLVLVAEDADLDANIVSEEIAGDVSTIKGFSGGRGTSSEGEQPTVLFPVMGEGRQTQLEFISRQALDAEVCPILPHPSEDPRRCDKLLRDYAKFFYDAPGVDKGNLLYADEANPFEAYQQLREAMKRYERSLSLLGDCRLWVAPLSSKLITVGVALACFELHSMDRSIGILYAEPQRYGVRPDCELESNATLTALALSGAPYRDD